MAQQLYFSRDTRMFIQFRNTTDNTELAADLGKGALWEIPVLDGYSFSQATNTSEIALAEMESSAGISSKNPTKIDKKNILTFKKHLNLLAFIQIPVLIGMISVLPIIREIKILPDIIIFICTLGLYTLIIRAIFVLYGYNLEVKDSLQLRYLKSFLIVIFTYIPSTMIFQLFISGLIKGVVELWI